MSAPRVFNVLIAFDAHLSESVHLPSQPLGSS